MLYGATERIDACTRSRHTQSTNRREKKNQNKFIANTNIQLHQILPKTYLRTYQIY